MSSPTLAVQSNKVHTFASPPDFKEREMENKIICINCGLETDKAYMACTKCLHKIEKLEDENKKLKGLVAEINNYTEVSEQEKLNEQIQAENKRLREKQSDDLSFLKEMKDKIESAKSDQTSMQYLEQMIDDWMAELKPKSEEE